MGYFGEFIPSKLAKSGNVRRSVVTRVAVASSRRERRGYHDEAGSDSKQEGANAARQHWQHIFDRSRLAERQIRPPEFPKLGKQASPREQLHRDIPYVLDASL